MAAANDGPRRVLIDRLHPNTWNPNVVPDHVMSALTINLGRAGFNQPVLVRPHPSKDGDYEIIDGEHRWRAAKERNDKRIDVIVRDFTDTEARAQTVAMNHIHGEMEPAEVARIFRELVEEGISRDELATFTGFTAADLADLDALLTLPPPEDPPDPDPDPDRWVTISYQVPESVATLFGAEIDRLKQIRETEHDHLAVELMVVNSSQCSPEQMTGDGV